MTKAFTSKQILKAIGNDKLNLYKGPGGGYWYFVYDDTDAGGAYGDVSVYCCYLNQMSFEKWVDRGQGAIEQVLKEYIDSGSPDTRPSDKPITIGTRK